MPKFEINTPSIVGEVIDGEAVVMDLGSGNYYSIQGTGAVVWACIESGCSTEAIEDLLRNGYADSDTAIPSDLEAFISEMSESGLIRLAENSVVESAPDPALLVDIAVYNAPEMQCFTDMQELLLLDPVHEVGETGWPAPPDK